MCTRYCVHAILFVPLHHNSNKYSYGNISKRISGKPQKIF